MIEIRRNITIQQLEDNYRLLYDSPERKVNLKLPAELDRPEFGLVAALIQFANTWIRLRKNENLVVSVPNNSERLAEWVRQDFVFPIVIMSWRYGIIHEETGNDIRNELRPLTQSMNLFMRSLSEVRGNQLLLTCFDHLPHKTGLLDCFYADGKFIEKEDVLEFTLLPSILKVLTFNKASFRKSIRQIMDDVRGLIFELIKNTDEWARTDKHNALLNPNIRGLYIKIVRRTPQSLVNQYQTKQNFRNFFDGLTPVEGHLLFMELSIFDSGPGFVDRYDPDSKHDEPIEKVNIIKKCLIRRSTSAQGVVSTGKGFGLDRILKILSGKGFLMIRTDSVFIYRNLKDHEYEMPENSSEVQLFDWQSGASDRFTNFAKASGSTLSIIYPLS